VRGGRGEGYWPGRSAPAGAVVEGIVASPSGSEKEGRNGNGQALPAARAAPANDIIRFPHFGPRGITVFLKLHTSLLHLLLNFFFCFKRVLYELTRDLHLRVDVWSSKFEVIFFQKILKKYNGVDNVVIYHCTII
jgi:hypothetical protein